MADDKKCKRCGACKECGSAPAVPLPQVIYIYPLTPAPVYQPNRWYTATLPASTGWTSSSPNTYVYTNTTGSASA